MSHEAGAQAVSPSSERSGDPRWIRAGVAAFLGELRAFFDTGFHFARHPVRFARAWSTGEERALNPAAMLATAAGFTLSVRVLLNAAAHHVDDDDGLLGQALDAVGPHVLYVSLGIVAHGVMRVAGSKRRLASSIGVALFAGAGPAWFADMLTITTVCVLRPFNDTWDSDLWGPVTKGVLGVVSIGSFFAFAGALCGGLKGLHDRRWGWSVLAVVTALVASGLVFGALPRTLPGKYGMHLTVRLPLHGEKPFFGLDDG